jgi:hypothetical protein
MELILIYFNITFLIYIILNLYKKYNFPKNLKYLILNLHFHIKKTFLTLKKNLNRYFFNLITNLDLKKIINLN